MIRRWFALTYYLYALRLAALSHFYFNPLYGRRNRPRRFRIAGKALRPPQLSGVAGAEKYAQL